MLLIPGDYLSEGTLEDPVHRQHLIENPYDVFTTAKKKEEDY
jgi:hypothetical protein